MMFTKMVLLSIKRRKKEIGFVSAVTFIAVLFLAGVTLFQNVMNRYVIENNYKNYGEWIFASLDKELSHPYFAATGCCTTGTEVVNEKGESIGESIGYLGDGFLDLANLTFYEGRLPEKDDEIVMNLTTLAKMGYSLDLGQTIHIKTQKVTEIMEGEEVRYETETFEKDFTLVGTVRDFSASWRYVDGHPLPSCVVTADAVSKMGGSLYTTHFYQLDRVYEDVDKEELKNGFLEPGVVVFNEYVYNKVVWGSQEMFADMQKLIRLIAVLMLSYLMMSYVSKRRSWYYKLRCTGAGKSQIWAMIFIEGLYGTLPWAILGFIVPYAGGAIACSYVSKTLGIPSIFVADGAQIMEQVLAVAGIIGLVLFIACLGTSDKRLSNNASEVTAIQLWRMKFAARGRKNRAKHFLKRQNMRNPLQRLAMAICAFVVSSVLICCTWVVMEEYEFYELVCGNRSDFEAYKSDVLEQGKTYQVIETDIFGKQKVVDMEFSSGHTFNKYDDGMNARLEAELNAIEGIVRREEDVQDSLSQLDWETKRESDTYLYAYKNELKVPFITDEERWRKVEDDMHFSVHMDTYEDLKRQYPLIFERADIDEDAFISGNQIIVICPEVEYSYVNENEEFIRGLMIKDTTLEDGMQVRWQNEYMGIDIPVTICKADIAREELADMNFLVGKYMIFASTGLAERVVAEFGTEVEYNHLNFDFEPNTSFGSTTKRLAAALVEHGFQYDIEWEVKEMARDEFLNSLCVYGTMFCMIFITYLVLQMNVQQMKHHNRSAQYLQMKRLGMSNVFFIWLNIKQALKECVWILPGVVTGYALGIIAANPDIFEPFESGHNMVESSITGEYTEDIYLILAEYMIDGFTAENLKIICGITLALILLIIIITTATAAKAIGKEEKVS